MKDKMTPAPWQLTANKDWIYAEKRTYDGGDIICLPPDMETSETHWEANAAAILSAVNATYGNGIDPEVVPEFLRILLAYIDADDSHADVWIKMQRLKKQARAAIEKAKL